MSVTQEPAELMDPDPVVGDDPGLTVHCVNLHLCHLAETNHAFKDGERCGDFSTG